ncbi:hypothetical protein EDWATA_01933 [Edwardsiella tarda ATCC 23685]|uniref:Uncharacterized protein n=1 Tax=Edwardsiella tarda ATCC 23685 TaxID=500638 RepID=D4F5A5_EDWTA|nr:hypothetical protein EDWATA_01933 [Edwardsiella tarda ATCC 23685]
MFYHRHPTLLFRIVLSHYPSRCAALLCFMLVPLVARVVIPGRLMA